MEDRKKNTGLYTIYWRKQVSRINILRNLANSVPIVYVRRLCSHFAAYSCVLMLWACDGTVWNDPYPKQDATGNVLYSTFAERPKHLDPVQSYSSNEYAFIGQIYEPPLQYHYLKRPFQLEPLTATSVPRPIYLDAQGNPLPDSAADGRIAFSVYEIRIKPGIKYQPHPAFARDGQGNLLYHNLGPKDLTHVHELADFKHSGSRELIAADYVYQIKRLAHPGLHSPIYSLMSKYIVGLKALADDLKKDYVALKKTSGLVYLDLTQYSLKGAEVVDRYTYRITVKNKYPQLLYWLAMPFFAPVAQEVDRFYTQPGMKERNITMDWYPVGTGAYMLTINNPNLRMVLERNPHFRVEQYPTQGESEDQANGLLVDAGKQLPFVDRVVYNLEKEAIPSWNKFLQGYYDASGIVSDSFDQAVQFNAAGDAQLTEDMEKKGIRLTTAIEPSTYYMGINMLDSVVGGYSKRARKLRRAISIAINYEEMISIFLNGRGIPAQGPLPPGIFGYLEGQAGINPYIYDWVNEKPRRKSLAESKRLLVEAGYPNGRDAKTGKPLLIHLDTPQSGPGAKAILDWYRKQLRSIDLELVIRGTDYNRFQEKVRTGKAQLFSWGWNADYPDPENFLFLLYGPNGKVEHHGENASNYNNPAFNQLFEQMKDMENGSQRQALINEMITIAQQDAPWLWGLHPKTFSLYHAWYKNVKPASLVQSTLKYRRLDPQLRAESRKAWNKPIVLPIVIGAIVLILSLIPGVITYRRKERLPLLNKESVS